MAAEGTHSGARAPTNNTYTVTPRGRKTTSTEKHSPILASHGYQPMISVGARLPKARIAEPVPLRITPIRLHHGEERRPPSTAYPDSSQSSPQINIHCRGMARHAPTTTINTVTTLVKIPHDLEFYVIRDYLPARL